jgi:hypothetical protein
MTKRPMRVYADTSVFGGALDPEFSTLSDSFFGRVREGAVELVVSAAVLDELESAPKVVRDFFEELAPLILRVEIGEGADALQQAYMRAQIVSPKWETDAMHVAVATVSGCRAIVSWNFKHIVNFRRIPLYNEVNRTEGYGPIAIHTPPEVIFDEED